MKIGDLVELKKESIETYRNRDVHLGEKLQGYLLFIISSHPRVSSKYETVVTVISPFGEGRLLRLFANDLKVVSPL